MDFLRYRADVNPDYCFSESKQKGTQKGMIHFRILSKSNVYLLWMVRFTILRVTSAALSSARVSASGAKCDFCCFDNLSIIDVVAMVTRSCDNEDVRPPVSKLNGPHREKIRPRCFRPGPTQIRLYSHRKWLEA